MGPQPIGQWPDGYWIEDTGPIRLLLTVNIQDMIGTGR
jgi:hypothetical protein